MKRSTCLSVVFLRAQAYTKMMVCPKYEMASGSEKEPKQYFCLAADASRKVVKTIIGEQVFLFISRRHCRTFGPTYDLEIFRLADPECRSFLTKTKQSVCDAPGPSGAGAFRASDAMSFLAAAPKKGPFCGVSAARAPNTKPLL